MKTAFVVVAAAVLFAVLAEGRNIAKELRSTARKGAVQMFASHSGFERARTMKAKSIEFSGTPQCQAYQSNLVETCGAWHDQISNNETLNFDDFCANPCWISASMPNNTACLLQNMELAGDIQFLKVACSNRGPSGSKCGNVMLKMRSDDQCSNFYTQSMCTNTSSHPIYRCHWNDNHCDATVDTTFLDAVCSPCINDYLQALANLVNATSSGSGSDQLVLNFGLVSNFQQLLCAQVDGQYCTIAAGDVLSNLTGGSDGGSASGSGSGESGISNAQVTAVCASNVQSGCLRKMLPATAGFLLTAALEEAQGCASEYAYQSATNFHNNVEAHCLPCYLKYVIDVKRTLSFGDNLCTKASSGTYCLTLLNFHPSEALQNCYINTASSHTCTSTCNDVFNSFFDNYGCCFGLFAQNLNGSSLLTAADTAQFWSAVNPIRYTGTTLAPTPMPPGPTIPSSPIFDGGDCNENDGIDVDLTKLSVCSSLGDIRTRMNTFCAYTRADVKIVKAISLKLNCTAVEANDEIRTAIVNALVRDIAQNIGLPVTAITGVLFICPTDAPAEHHFRQMVANAATLQFVIQSDNAAATNAAGAQFDTAITAGALSFPTLTSTVNTQCTTCASQADLANLATTTSVVPTPAPSSSSSIVELTIAVFALLAVALML